MCRELELKPLILTMNGLGLLSCGFNKNVSQGYFRVTRYHKLRSFVILCLSQIASGSMLTYLILFDGNFNLKGFNSTGNIYINLNLELFCFLMSIIYLYFYICQHYYLRLLELLLKYYKDDFSHYRSWPGWSPRRLYALYVFLVTTNFINVYVTFVDFHLEIVVWILYQFACNMSFVLCGIVVFSHVCFTKTMSCFLVHINIEIDEILHERKVHENIDLLRVLMTKRESLIDLCRQEVSKRFAPLNIAVIAFIIFSGPSGPYYFVTVIVNTDFNNVPKKIVEFVATVYWNVPWLILLFMFLNCKIEKQVKKTSKILSNSLRKNIGIDHMISNFLLKNFRRKPLFTAHGFFSYNRITLFNVVSSVFTYMVILVQFKELESATKGLSNSKS